MRFVLFALVALVAAGCVQPPAATNDDASNATATLPFADPMGHDHDHSDIALHAFAWNVEMLDHHPLAGSASHSSGAHALDLKAGWLFAAVYGGAADAEGGVFIFNTSDPQQPKLVGRYQFPGSMGGDRSMEATEDGNFVVLGTEPVDCAGHIAPAGPGLYLVDTHDKTNPTLVDYLPSTGVHSVTIHRVNGADYVFGLMPDKNVIKIDTSGVKPRLVPVAELPIGHDSVVVADQLLDGKPLLYASNGGGGFEIWDVSKPETPEKLGGWNIPDRPKGKYYIHTGDVSFIGGKRIAVVTTEDWEDYPSEMYVLDATHLDGIDTLASWRAPGDHAANGLRYSMHNPRFDGNVVELAYYHGGLWRIDLSTPEKPVVVGQYSPTESNGYKPSLDDKMTFPNAGFCGTFYLADAPFVFDVEPGDGVIYIADLHTGLYTLRSTAGATTSSDE